MTAMSNCLRSPSVWVLALLGLVTALSGCKSEPLPEPVERDGPPFAEAFPDPTVLLTTSDVKGTRAELSTVQLPSTREHHDELVELLRSVDAIDVEHLLLLTEAVDLSVAESDEASWPAGTKLVIESSSGDSDVRILPARGTSPFADVVDTLLLEGTAKLAPIDEFDAGRVLGRTQSDETLGALADVFLPTFDATSAGSLRELLNGFGGSSARIPFVTKILAPGGTLVGEREDVALLALTFDEERVAVATALIESRDRITIDDLNRYLERMSFDDARVDVLRTAIPKLPILDADALVGVLRRLAFDDAKVEAVRRLAEAKRLRILIEDLRAILQNFHFDDPRQAAIEILAPSIGGTVNSVIAGGIIRLFSLDSTRSRAVIGLAPKLAELDAGDRDRLLRNIEDEHAKAEAREALEAAVAAGAEGG